MPKISGTLIIWSVDGEQMAHTKDATLTINRELPDATTKDSGGWEEHLSGAGLRNAEGTFEGLADWETGGTVDTLYAHIESRGDVTGSFGNATGIQFDGQIGITNLDFDAPLEEAATLSGGWKFNGEPVKTDNTTAS